MSVFSEWPHRWFGYWASVSKDHSSGKTSLPLISDFVDEKHSHQNRDEIAFYLLNAPRIVTVPTCECRFERDNPEHVATLCLRTDGEWLWWDDIVHYMEYHNLRLPDGLIKHIADKNFDPPKSLELKVQDMLERLEWPVIPSVISQAPKMQVLSLRPF